MTDMKLERWFDERVEPYVEGDLPANERALFEARLALDAQLASAVARARQLGRAFERLPQLDCPDELSRRVFQMTRSRPRLPAFGWALAGAMALAIGVGVTRYMVSNTSEPSPLVPDAAQLAKARADLELALAYVDRAGQVAARTVGQQVVTRGVVEPMAAGLTGHRDSGISGEAI